MSSIIAPGSARLRKFTIGGMDLTGSVRELKIFESIMRPFQVSEVIIIDTTNMINRGKWEGGEDVSLVFDAGQGKVYETKMKLHSVGNENNLPSMRGQVYKLNVVGESFFNNKGSKVTQPFQNISGAKAIEKIHNQYLKPTDASLKIEDSKGFIGEKVPFIVSSQHALEAISNIRYRLLHEKYKTGAYTYFRDNEQYRLVPLEQLFSELNPNERLENDPTMGKSFTDIQKQGRNIFEFQMGASFGGTGKNSPADAQRMGKNAMTNTRQMGEAYAPGKRKDPPPGQVSGNPAYKTNDNSSSQYERTVKYVPNDRKLNAISPIAEKMDQEQLYARLIQNGPSCTVGVMLDSGINCTVGKGVFANIAAPVGDMNPGTDNQVKGNYLVVNLCHHIKTYDDKPQGTTKMELAKGGFT